MRVRLLVLASTIVASAIACGSADRDGYDDPAATHGDSGEPASSIVGSEEGLDGKDGGRKKDSGSKVDAGASSPSDAAAEAAFDSGFGDAVGVDTGASDAGSPDAGSPDTGSPDTGGATGPVTGGPCASGAVGATALRVKWTNAGGKAQASYQVNGLPDKSRWKTSAYGYQIGFTPSYVDPFLASGGLLLDGSDFIDIELSTVGLAVIRAVTLSLHGRSFHTTASGSFNWQTAEGTGATVSGVVSNVTPYAWTSADATTELSPGKGNALLRIKAGPPSSALVVSSVELCIDAD